MRSRLKQLEENFKPDDNIKPVMGFSFSLIDMQTKKYYFSLK